MVYFYRSPQAIVISALCTIAIAAFIYFVMVKPETDHANRQVDHATVANQRRGGECARNYGDAQRDDARTAPANRGRDARRMNLQ